MIENPELENPQETPVTVVNTYVAFVQQLELINIWLRSARVTNSSGGATFTHAEVSIGDTSTWKEIDGGFQAFHKYTITFSDGKKKLGRIDVEFVGDYASHEPMDDDLFELFRENNLPLNTWPYFREYVSNTTGRMQWLPFTLPTRKFLSTPTLAAHQDDDE